MKSSLRSVALTAILATATVVPSQANNLERTAEAARQGDYGLESSYTGNRQKNFLVRELQTSEARIYVRFFIRPDGEFEITRGKANVLLQLRQNGRRKPVVEARLRKDSGGFRLQFRVMDGGKRRRLIKKLTNQLFLPFDEWSEVEIDWIAATGPGVADGSVTVWKNGGEPFARVTGLDNEQDRIEEIRVGQVSKTKTGWFGSIYLDELLLRRRR